VRASLLAEAAASAAHQFFRPRDGRGAGGGEQWRRYTRARLVK